MKFAILVEGFLVYNMLYGHFFNDISHATQHLCPRMFVQVWLKLSSIYVSKFANSHLQFHNYLPLKRGQTWIPFAQEYNVWLMLVFNVVLEKMENVEYFREECQQNLQQHQQQPQQYLQTT